MIKYGKFVRKAAAVALALALAAAMIRPASIYAEDAVDVGNADGEKVENISGENARDEAVEVIQPDGRDDISEKVDDEDLIKPNEVEEVPQIESVSVSHNGKFVKVGESVEVIIKVKNRGNIESGEIVFRSLNDSEARPAVLTYDAEQEVYIGVWVVTQDMESCEWYLSSIDIHDDAGNRADDNPFTYYPDFPYYVKVMNGEMFTEPMTNICVEYYALDESGEWNRIGEVKKENVKRRTTLKELGVVFPEVKVKYSDFKQVGWMDCNGHEVTENMRVMPEQTTSGYYTISLYVRYDKTRAEYQYSYMSGEGKELDSFNVKINLPADYTYRDAREKALSAAPPEVCPSGLIFQGWEAGFCGVEDARLNGIRYTQNVTAVYDKNMISVAYSYFNDKNEWCTVTNYEIVDKNVTYGDVLKEANKYQPKDMAEGYILEKWECSREDLLDEVVGERDDIVLTAKYPNKFLVPFSMDYINESHMQATEDDVLLVDEGITVGEVKELLNKRERPKMYPGIKFIRWDMVFSNDQNEDRVIEKGESVSMKACYTEIEEVPSVGGGDGNITVDPLPDISIEAVKNIFLMETFDFSAKNQIVGEYNILDFSLTSVYTHGDEEVFATFIHESGEGEKTISMKQTGDRTYWGTTFIGKAEKEGMWFLKEMYVVREGNHEKVEVNDPKSYCYMLKRADENDTENPKIISVNVEKNGEFVQAGQSIRFTIQATDNKGFWGYGNLYLRNLAQNGSREVALRYNVTEDVFEGTFTITDDMRSGEWFVDKIDIRDSARNCADDDEFTKGGRYPYYLKVMNGEEYTEALRDVYIEFLGWDEQGEWRPIQAVYKKDVSLRTTLKELGISFPEKKFSDFNITGWADGYGNEITEDTMIPYDINNWGWQIKAEYDQVRVSYAFEHVSKDGDMVLDVSFRNENYPIGTTFKEAWEGASKYYESIESYPELHVSDWEIIKENDETEKLKPGCNDVYLRAMYDEAYLRVGYSYFNSEGKWCEVIRPIVVDDEMTYEEVLKQVKEYRPDDISKEYPFDEWDGDIPETLDEALWKGRGGLSFTAKYPGKTVISVMRTYYDERGQRPSADVALVVDEGTTKGEVRELINQWEKPAMHPELRFKEWDISLYGNDGDIVKNGNVVRMKAVYENCIVRYILDSACEKEDIRGSDFYDRKEDFEFIYCQVVEKGDTVTIPTTFEGYESVTWTFKNMSAESFDVNSNKDFIGYGKKTEEPQNPEQTEISKEEIAEVVDQINKVTNEGNAEGNGDTPVIPIEMNNAKILPWEILEAAKGKEITIELRMGAAVAGGFQYTWTIKGNTIEDDFESINLGVAADKNAIPEQIIQKLAGTNSIQQLSLEHSGKFGFEASLSINVGSQHAGRFGNLFYFNNGKMEFMNTSKVDPQGNVALGFNHASDYVVVLSDEEMSQASVPKDLQPENKEPEENTDKDGDEDKGDVNQGDGDKDGANKEETGSNGESNQGNQNSSVNNDANNNKVSDTNSADKSGGDSNTAGHRRSAKTGDGNEAMPFVLCSILALGVIVSIRRRSTRSI